MIISIGADHAGYHYKSVISDYLHSNGLEIIDYGVNSAERADYPDFAYAVAESVGSGEAQYGILICGTGTGMSITANKVSGIRAANCCSTEMAELARSHNNANVLCLGARLISIELAKEICDKFFDTPFDGGRHELRVSKIHNLTGL